jgi:hypothetical protein
MKKVASLKLWCALAAIAVLGHASSAKFANPTEKLPADRMIKNAKAWIKENPKDAQGYYVLGRVHSMAWAYGPEITLIKPADDKSLPSFAAFQEVQVRHPEETPRKEEIDHLQQALAAYGQAVTLDQKNALYALGYAWTLQETANHAPAEMLERQLAFRNIAITAEQRRIFEQAGRDLGSSDSATREKASATLREGMIAAWVVIGPLASSSDPEVKARVIDIAKSWWEVRALEQYRAAHALALPEDQKRDFRGPGANSQISSEAGQAILDILKARPYAAKTDEVKQVTAAMQSLRAGGRAVTPIIFAMPQTGPAGLPQQVGDLLDSCKRVAFDIAGDDVPRIWPWLKDGTALLVWDPRGTGNITSGRQLFGSATWWISFRNGYEALSLLDDNRDGKLAGGEMQGIAVWIDRNGDAVSQPGEVISLQQAGIREIAARPDAPGHLTASRGITFSNGQSVKSFDWITTPVAEDATSK